MQNQKKEWNVRRVPGARQLLLAAVALLEIGLLTWGASGYVLARGLQQGGEVPVTLVDGEIQMPNTLPSGPTTFSVTNNGSFDHGLEIEGQGFSAELEPVLAPGESGTLQVDLAPGVYEVYCPVDDHRNNGMQLNLTVTVTDGAGAAQQATGTPAAQPTDQPAAEPTAEPAAEATAAPAAEPSSATGAETGTVALPGNPSIALVKVADGLADPVNVAAPNDGSGRVFVVERIGRIRIIQDGQLLDTPFLDLQDVVKTDFLEQGLLGLAFHPDFANNGRFFVYYSDYLTNGDVFLVEYHVSADDPNVADPNSARVLLTQDKPFVNHNGGTLRFGPDGYLYVSLGDGGLAGDPYRNAQDLSMLLGKILRLDVDTGMDESGQPTGGHPYAIPAGNPFQGQVQTASVGGAAAQTGAYQPDARPEIFAYGLRNPWQFNFDPQTGDLYIADVGQNKYEEVNYVPAHDGTLEGGMNFGWPLLEGTHCYGANPNATPGTGAAAEAGSSAGAGESAGEYANAGPGGDCGLSATLGTAGTLGTLPVADYDHDDGSCSITGMGVYRGSESPSLDGIYFNADYCSGKIWGLQRGDDGAWAYQVLLDTALQISGAGSDTDGGLYVTACACEYSRSYNALATAGGSVWRLVASDIVPAGAETAPLEEGTDQQGEAGKGDTEPAQAATTTEMTATAATTATVATTDTAAAGASGGGENVDVSLVDGEIRMPTTVTAGNVVFAIQNDGTFKHSLKIEGQGVSAALEPVLEAGQSRTLEVDLALGEYTVTCPVSNHAQHGMKLTLTVQ